MSANRKSQLRLAGLGTAMRESGLQRDCRNDHSVFFDKGYTFCPHCGVKIELIRNCPTCGKRFFSGKAFRAHAIAAHRRGAPINKRVATPEAAHAKGYREGANGETGPFTHATYKNPASVEAYVKGWHSGRAEYDKKATK